MGTAELSFRPRLQQPEAHLMDDNSEQIAAAAAVVAAAVVAAAAVAVATAACNCTKPVQNKKYALQVILTSIVRPFFSAWKSLKKVECL